MVVTVNSFCVTSSVFLIIMKTKEFIFNIACVRIYLSGSRCCEEHLKKNPANFIDLSFEFEFFLL